MPHPAFPPVEILDQAQTAWSSTLQPAGCARCKQAHLVEAARIEQVCPSCGRGVLEAQPALLRPEPPELLVPFRKAQSDLYPILDHFVNQVWFRPNALNPMALLQQVVPVYWPVWLVDGDMTADWQAEVGFDYQVRSSQESYRGEGWQTRQVVETRIRWEPRAGLVDRHYDNITAPAISDQERLAGLVGDYALNEAVAFAADQVSQAVVRIPDQNPANAWPLAQPKFVQAAADECRRAAGGQHIRNFTLHANYQSLHWTQLLLPFYFTYYRDDHGHAHPIYINGQTGKIGGRRVASQRKGWLWSGILLGCAIVALVMGLLCLALASFFPPLVGIGAVLQVLAFLIALGAIVPAVWSWQWNRTQD